MLSPDPDSSAAPPPDGPAAGLADAGGDIALTGAETSQDDSRLHETPGADLDLASAAPVPPLPTRPAMSRGRAVAEVVLCSSYPTQVAAAAALVAAGVPAQHADGGLNATFVFAVSTLDALMVVGLIVFFLRRNRDVLADVFFGARAIWREAALGVAIVPLVTLGVGGVVLAARKALPSLHNVDVNPLTSFMADPALAVLFAVIVVLAGGVREEMQRAFQLHRLSRHVCSPLVALALTSVAFGLGHTVQGRDVALATFGLGVLWGAMYLARRSLVAGAVSHGLFNLGQVAIGWAASQRLDV